MTRAPSKLALGGDPLDLELTLEVPPGVHDMTVAHWLGVALESLARRHLPDVEKALRIARYLDRQTTESGL